MRRTLAVLLAASACVGGLSACGNEEATSHAESEGVYFNVGGLRYQVQVSRPLNPRAVEDRDYFKGIPASQAALPTDATWFAVFVRARNVEKRPARSADDTGFKIVDTQGDEYFPIPVDNILSYASTTLAPKGDLPDQDSVARFGPTQGSLLLFKIPKASLENRPLELHVAAPGAETPREGTVVLDV